ncbi:hypothetical protein Taro_051109 [Colocasia esculenta]|uniref:Uncharacterized protein n=1 Tax=Colocasia esculenta TaxID=4460 RepID=A0A843XFV7_COLES|nr:hypothetical protein [Colocasia esculenta]
MSKLQPFFPSYNRTPKYLGCLNTLHQTLGDEFTSCWGRVGKFLAAGEQEIVHTKPFFFPFSSAATCTNRPLEVDQRSTLACLGWFKTSFVIFHALYYHVPRITQRILMMRNNSSRYPET